MASPNPWSPSDTTRLIHCGRNSVHRLEYFQKHSKRPRVLAMKTVARPEGVAEALAMQEICSLHEGFLRFYHQESTPTHVSLYMEFADFGDANQLTKSLQLYGEPYPQSQILEIAYTLTGAVVAMHRQGWAHRDIKPRNIFVFLKGTVKIGDFGVSKRVFNPTGDNTLQGTEAFMSPNLTAGLYNDSRTVRTNPFKDDVYALGSSLFTIASWAYLSEMGIPEQSSESIFEGFIRASLQRYSEDLQALLCAMVHYDEAKRPTAMEAYTAVLAMLSIVERLEGCSTCTSTDILAVLDCGHRMCPACFSQLVASQLDSACSLREFKCSQCDGCIGASVLLANIQAISSDAGNRIHRLNSSHNKVKRQFRLSIV